MDSTKTEPDGNENSLINNETTNSTELIEKGAIKMDLSASNTAFESSSQALPHTADAYAGNSDNISPDRTPKNGILASPNPSGTALTENNHSVYKPARPTPSSSTSGPADESTVRYIENRVIMPIPSADDMLLFPRAQVPEDPGAAKLVPQYNKAFRYDHAVVNPTVFPSMQYTMCEPPPYKPGINPLERGLNTFLVGHDAQTVTTPGAYSSAKGDMCMRGGSWYFEIEVVNPSVRLGIGRREATCEGPVGFDSYSYGVQSNNGWKVHCARTVDFTEPLVAGDILGFHVHLPIDSRPKEVVRSRVPLKYQDQIWLESMNYKSTQEMDQFVLPKNYREPLPSEVIPGSFCKVWRKGALVGTLAEPLRDFRPPHSQFEFWLRLPSEDDGYLGYFPMISVYKGGAARLNCGPDFENSVPEGARPLCERYDEQIADDFAMDLLNEIAFEEIDEKLPPAQQDRKKLKTFKEKKLVVRKML